MNKFVKFSKIVLAGVFIFSSSFSFVDAAGRLLCDSTSMDSISGIINWAACLLNDSVIPLLFTLAVVAFIWGVIQFYLNPDNEEKRKKGKSFIVGGLIALFVMVSFWGIIGIFTNTFDLGNKPPVDSMPTFQE